MEKFDLVNNKIVKQNNTEVFLSTDIESGEKNTIDIDKIPQGWKNNNTLSVELGANYGTVKRISNKYRINHPEFFKEFKSEKNAVYECYSPELVVLITEEINKNNEIKKAPENWKTCHALQEELEVKETIIKKIVEKYKKTNPTFFELFKGSYKNEEAKGKGTKKGNGKAGRIYEHFSPELVEIVRQEILSKKENKQNETKQEKLKTDFEDFIQDISDEQTDNEQAIKIREILRLLPGNSHDIILQYHPQYKGLSVDYIKRIISDYLGDFLLIKNEWKERDLEDFKEVIGTQDIRESILAILKNACLNFINNEKKNNPDVEEYKILEQYFQKPEMVAAASISEMKGALQELKKYYEDIFELQYKKPYAIVESLKIGRVFPDINQLLNIKEIKEKKKMLIADEMGLGKSASAILAKEYLEIGCAVIIVPSNVIDTWENYLSDHVDQNGKQVGYFKSGFAPKVLVVNSFNDLGKLQSETFDYVVISQERFGGEKYGEVLGSIDFDMLIVDEVHKLKNIETGVRSESMLDLAEKMNGENKYLTLLSGTPIPNKVKDIAISLKLLYPEKYKEFSSKEMVGRILYGDLIDLRTELLMRMQMKELVTSIEMPERKEQDIEVILSKEEREIYEILLEEEELTASEKIVSFRQFLLNPELLKVEPGFPGAKIEKLQEVLNEDLKTNEKIVVFVNGYIEGVIRGESTIVDKLNLPTDVKIEEIHGEISKEERKMIEEKLKTNGQKMILFVGGQTADVGVDFSGADNVIFYNEPWSKYDKRQQQSRVYREGLKSTLTVKTLLTKDSIEEGIRRYINSKEKAIEKLLRGIGNTNAEKKLLRTDSNLEKENIETNAELSNEYMSDWEKLMMHFGEGFEVGEKEFKQELEKKGKEYAELYRKLGRLTYQGNNARVTATFLENMIQEKKQEIGSLRILDIASGPEMLKEAASEKLQDRIFSMDINKEHFIHTETKTKRIVGSYISIPAKDNSLDYCNLGFAFHQTSPIKFHKKNYERLQVLAEMNRVLKVGGRSVISMLHNVTFKNHEMFKELIENLGFKIVSKYTGKVVGDENYTSHFYTFEKTEDIVEYKSESQKYIASEVPKDINMLADRVGNELLKSLEIEKVKEGKSRLKDQRRMIENVMLHENKVKIIFNSNDADLYDNEIQSIKDAEDLKEKYGGISNIPIDEIKRIGFERKLKNQNYYLLYKIIKDGGAVVVRGDYKRK